MSTNYRVTLSIGSFSIIVALLAAVSITLAFKDKEVASLKKQIQEDSLVPDGYYNALISKVIPLCQWVSQVETGQDFPLAK